jgi:chromosome segregation ATPase
MWSEIALYILVVLSILRVIWKQRGPRLDELEMRLHNCTKRVQKLESKPNWKLDEHEMKLQEYQDEVQGYQDQVQKYRGEVQKLTTCRMVGRTKFVNDLVKRIDELEKQHLPELTSELDERLENAERKVQFLESSLVKLMNVWTQGEEE